jgi:hypothetical protein
MSRESSGEKMPLPNILKISFLDIPFQVLREKELKAAAILEKISTAVVPCEIKGNPFLVQLQKTEGFEMEDKKPRDEFLDIQISDEHEVPVIGGNISFRFGDAADTIVKLSISKKKRTLEERNPDHVGLGQEIYKQMMRYIQEKADILKIPITALVRKMPNGISSESWDNVFTQMLTEAGYTKVFDDEEIAWKKTYEPKEN